MWSVLFQFEISKPGTRFVTFRQTPLLDNLLPFGCTDMRLFVESNAVSHIFCSCRYVFQVQQPDNFYWCSSWLNWHSQFKRESFVGSTNPPSPVHVQVLPVNSLFTQRHIGFRPVTVLASIESIDTAMRMCNTSVSLQSCTSSLSTVSTLMNLPRSLVWQSNPT